MRINGANRHFVYLLLVAHVVYGVVGLGACLGFALVVYQVADGGVEANAGGLTLATLIFLAVATAGWVYGLASLAAQMLDSRRLRRRLQILALPPDTRLTSSAAKASLTGRVVLVDGDDSFSFAFGVLTPRVAVSRGLCEALTPAELEAVLEHERYHVENLDPFKVLLGRALSRTFFYVPALADLERRDVASRELAADRNASDRCGRGPLAGALLKATRGPAWTASGAAVAEPDLLDIRVVQLEQGREPPLPPTSRTVFLLSIAGAMFLGASVAATLARTGDPAVLAALGPLGALALAGIQAALVWFCYVHLRARARKALRTSR